MAPVVRRIEFQPIGIRNAAPPEVASTPTRRSLPANATSRTANTADRAAPYSMEPVLMTSRAPRRAGAGHEEFDAA